MLTIRPIDHDQMRPPHGPPLSSTLHTTIYAATKPSVLLLSGSVPQKSQLPLGFLARNGRRLLFLLSSPTMTLSSLPLLLLFFLLIATLDCLLPTQFTNPKAFLLSLFLSRNYSNPSSSTMSKYSRTSGQGKSSNRPAKPPRTTVLLLNSDLTVTRATPPPKPTQRGSSPLPTPFDELYVPPFQAALNRDGHKSATGLIAQSLHIMGLPNDGPAHLAAMQILADRLEDIGILIDTTDLENPDSALHQDMAALTPSNGRRHGALGSSKSRPTAIVKLRAGFIAIAYGLHPPDSIAYPPFLIFNIPVSLTESDSRRDITYITITCTMLPQETGPHLQQDTISTTVQGQNWHHVINVLAILPILDCALGAIMYDLVDLMLDGLTLANQEEVRTNLIMVPFHPAFSRDADDTSLSGLKATALAIHFRTDTEDIEKYQLLDHIKTALLGNNQARSRAIRLNGIALSLSLPTAPTSPVNIPTSIVPKSMSKPKLYLLTLRDLHSWISTAHLALILTHALGLGKKVITILLRTPRVDETFAHRSVKYRPDAMVLLDSLETLATALRSEAVIKRCIERLHQTAPHDQVRLYPSISSLNRDKRDQLKQLDRVDRGSELLIDNEDITYDMINQAAETKTPLPDLAPPPPPSPPAATAAPAQAQPRAPRARALSARETQKAQEQSDALQAASALAALDEEGPQSDDGESLMDTSTAARGSHSPPRSSAVDIVPLLSPGGTKRHRSGHEAATNARIDQAALLRQLKGEHGNGTLTDILGTLSKLSTENDALHLLHTLDTWVNDYQQARDHRQSDF